MNDFDHDYLKTIDSFLVSGDVSIVGDDSSYLDILGLRFPFGSRLHWCEVCDSEKLNAPLIRKTEGVGGHSQFDYEKYLSEEVLVFIRHVSKSYSIGKNEKVVVLGDAMSFALAMEWGILARIAGQVFRYPQNFYVIPDSGDWCLNYTFEDDVYFGFAPEPE